MNRLLVVILAVATSALISSAASAEESKSPKPPVRPKTIFAHYMGCCPLATGPQAHYKREEAKTLRHDSSDKAAQHGGHVRNWDLAPYGMELTAEESADLEIRRAMRIGIDGFAIDAWAGNKDARRSLDALLKIAAEKNYPFEVTICIDPMCGGDIVASVKELLEKHGKNSKLARRDGKPLSLAYYLKEELRAMWSFPDIAQMSSFFDDWCRRAADAGVPLLASLAKTLRGFRSAILNGWVYAISNGKLEGINNKIGAMQRMHYGLRDFEFLSLRILTLHKAKHTFCG